MRRVEWHNRQSGDIFLYHGSGLLSSMIRAAELSMHPGAPEDFVPSHTGGVADGDMVVEARMDSTVDSVAAVQPASVYNDDAIAGRVELWRPDAAMPLGAAVNQYIQIYAPMKYGELNLIGFEWVAIVESLFHENVVNPIKDRLVCSQGMMIMLGKFIASAVQQELWAEQIALDSDKLSNCDPLQLRMYFIGNQH